MYHLAPSYGGASGPHTSEDWTPVVPEVDPGYLPSSEGVVPIAYFCRGPATQRMDPEVVPVYKYMKYIYIPTSYYCQ